MQIKNRGTRTLLDLGRGQTERAIIQCPASQRYQQGSCSSIQCAGQTLISFQVTAISKGSTWKLCACLLCLQYDRSIFLCVVMHNAMYADLSMYSGICSPLPLHTTTHFQTSLKLKSNPRGVLHVAIRENCVRLQA